MGKKTFGTVTNSRYPKGCFFLNNKVYFNPGKTGRGHGAASPVCVAKAGATKKPAKKLVLAANGKATCAGKGAAVKNENACKAAAKAMKKKFASSGAYASLPKGCFLLNNQFYYNKGKTGKGNSKARAVCVSGATGGKKPAPKFAMAGNGKANCGKLKPVATEKACRASANVIAGKGQIQFGSAGAFGSYPKGCFVYSNKLYFNKGKTGKENSKANPVCVAKATGGKETTPKKKPKKTTPKKKPAPKFAMAGNGKANCGKLKAVATEKACRASAKVIKKQFGSAGAFGSYPKGCFVYNNKLYFNKGKTGKANSKSNPVCVAKATGGKKTTPKKNGGCAKARKCMNVKGKAMCGKCPKGYTNSGTKQCKKATATKKPATKLVLAGKGKANCAGKGAAVKGQNGCKAAAKSMKKTFGTVTNSRYPKGCFLLNNKVYFNPGKTGRGHGAASPVCVAKAGATKKPAKKLVLAASGKASCSGK